MEFLRFVSDLYGFTDGLFRKRAEELLIRFSLYDWSDHLIEAYSHGMKQRLIIASALLHEPRVIIVDEPMVGLDPAGIRMVKDLLRELAEGGTTIFMSTHTLEIAEDLCNRIGVIHHGRLVALGSTGDLRGTAQLREGDLEDVFLRLKELSYAANLSTVYRALETFAHKNLVEKLVIAGENKALFGLGRAEHAHHLICLECRSILAVEHCPLGQYEETLAKETAFEIAGHNLDIYGYCPKCRSKKGRTV